MPVLHEDSLDYTPRPRSVRLVRQRTARLVTAWGHPALAEDAVLIVSELATNAVRHGCLRDRFFRVRLAHTEKLSGSRSAIPGASACR